MELERVFRRNSNENMRAVVTYLTLETLHPPLSALSGRNIMKSPESLEEDCCCVVKDVLKDIAWSGKERCALLLLGETNKNSMDKCL